jgi:hypothetical protein
MPCRFTRKCAESPWRGSDCAASRPRTSKRPPSPAPPSVATIVAGTAAPSNPNLPTTETRPACPHATPCSPLRQVESPIPTLPRGGNPVYVRSLMSQILTIGDHSGGPGEGTDPSIAAGREFAGTPAGTRETRSRTSSSATKRRPKDGSWKGPSTWLTAGADSPVHFP